MPKPHARALIAIAAAFALLPGCLYVAGPHAHGPYQGAEHHRSWSRTIDAADLARGEALRITNAVGDVELIASDGPPRIDAKAASRSLPRLDGLRITTTLSDGVLELAPEWPGGWHEGDVCDLVIFVPARRGVRIRTAAGDVAAHGMAGHLSITTSAGDVEIERHDGPIRVETSAGDVTATRIAGDAQIRTSAGDIDLFDADWPIEAVTSAGDITVRMLPGFGGTIRASTSAGDITLPNHPAGWVSKRAERRKSLSVAMGSDAAECVFRTSAGDIDVTIHASENAAMR